MPPPDDNGQQPTCNSYLHHDAAAATGRIQDREMRANPTGTILVRFTGSLISDHTHTHSRVTRGPTVSQSHYATL